ncbi:MAG: bifunctional metallophosphatase/5'-nucleotidase [Owenweeksia sp.]
MLLRFTFLLSFLIFSYTSMAQVVKITFLQLNDVYEMSAVSGGKLGGFARVQTLLDSLKKDNPNTFTVLAGDMLSPSAIGTATYQGEKMAGRQMVDVLNVMNWDYFIFGNHEFDLKEPDLRKRLDEMKFTLIADNVLDSENKPFPNTTKQFKIEVEGISIGILGITLRNFKTSYANISDPLQAAKKEVERLQKEKTDIIVAITHQSIESDVNLAVEVPEIDMIMGGHEHENYHLLRGDHYTPVTKADANAKTVFIHQLEYRKSSGELKIHSQLVFMDESIPEDPAIKALVQKWTDIAFASFEKQGYHPRDIICISTDVLDGSESAVRSRSTGLTDLITAGFITAYPQADASLMNGGSIRIDDKLQPGPISEYDIMRISPFGGDISLVSMEGSTLIRALEQGLKNEGTGAFLQYSNILKSGAKWKLGEDEIQPEKEYRIAISSYLVEKGDQNLGFLTYDEGLVKKTDAPKKEFFQVVINQFKKQYSSTN